MGMGIVSDKDFMKEREKLIPSTSEKSNPITDGNGNGKVVDAPTKGRGTGNVQVPNTLRNIIGEESAINGRQSALELAQSFGISPSSVSAYDAGATSTASYNSRPNLPIINQAKERIAKRARNKLMSALSKITDEKLEAANAKDLSSIAKDMTAVVKGMEPEPEKTPDKGSNGPTFVFYAPHFRNEEHYDIVHVKE